MKKSLRRQVLDRAGGECEYCRLPQKFTVLPHEVDHIRARKHRGQSNYSNTCLACAYCNGSKGSNVAGFDPLTDALVPLFNPRTDRWRDHFAWQGPILVGITSIGRATIEVLRINSPKRLEHRQGLISTGLHQFGNR